ncbi:CRISPR-associated endonuclease Cas2 [Deltaproteobacteria bacterium TL4]
MKISHVPSIETRVTVWKFRYPYQNTIKRGTMDHRLIITYDITDDKIRTLIHKYLRNYGINSQKSVFEMIVNDNEMRKIIDFLIELLPHDPKDTVRIYEICKPCTRHISRLGEGIDLNPFAYEII